MDLVAGGSLAHVIGDYGALPPRFVCTLLDQLLAGLAAVHAEGVVHRDIKPANILMAATGTGRPHLRLSDFGISMRKGEPRLTETDYVVGTPGYFAPEQLLGAEPDFPADFFATGLVALYLLQGRKPDAQALVEHFLAHGTPDAPEGVPAPLWDVIANLLQPDPQSRFKTATGARKALAEAVELLPPAAPDEDPVEVFDQLGPLPAGFGPQGPQNTAAVTPRTHRRRGPARASGARGDHADGPARGRPAPAPVPAAGPDPVVGHGRTRPRPDARSHPDVGPRRVRRAPRRVRAAPDGIRPLRDGQFPPAAAGRARAGHHPARRRGTGASRSNLTAHSDHTHRPGRARVGDVPRLPDPPPPAKVTAAVLAAALLCFAVGVWALTRV